MGVKRLIGGLLSGVTDVVLPPRCWVTGEACDGRVGLSDTVCEQIGRMAAHPYCMHCGLTVGPYELHDARDPCGRCGERKVGVVRMARVGTFSGPLVTLVHRLKFGRSWEVARVAAPLMYSALLRVAELTEADVGALVPVGLHWRRRATRGFNQAEELAREVGKISGWRVVTGLRRVKRTEEQARVTSATARADNLRGAFVAGRAARNGALAGKDVWLVDDVSTTGATLQAAAVALRRLPREKRPLTVNAVVLCVTDHRVADAAPRVAEGVA